jgi:general stress protein YciG
MAQRNQGGGTSNRGFASMDPARQRAIAAEGGRAAHAQGVAHEFDSEEAREAGRKGGQARSQRSAANASSDRDVQGADLAHGDGMGGMRTPSGPMSSDRSGPNNS